MIKIFLRTHKPLNMRRQARVQRIRLNEAVAAFGLACAMGCSAAKSPAPPAANPSTASNSSALETQAKGDEEMAGSAKVAEKVPLRAEEADALWSFTLDYLRPHLHHSGQNTAENIVLAPASMSAALSTLYFAVQGESAAEIARALHLESRDESIGRGLAALQSVGGSTANSALALAFRLDVEQSLALRAEFSSTVQRFTQSSVASQDFLHQAERARNEVNQWVSAQTHNKIAELLPPQSLDSETRVVLTNAFYFRAPWQEGMDPAQTKLGTFRCEDGREVSVPMMQKNTGLRGTIRQNYGIYFLDHAEQPTQVMVIVPGKTSTIDSVLETLNAAEIRRARDEQKAMESKLIWPKLKLGSQRGQGSATELQKLGIKRVFNAKEADFSRLVDNPQGFVLDDVYQAALLEIDEAGTVAAAATGAVLSKRSFVMPVVLDRPFALALVDRASGLPYVVAVVRDPSLNPS
jgi:serpin B